MLTRRRKSNCLILPGNCDFFNMFIISTESGDRLTEFLVGLHWVADNQKKVIKYIKKN